MYMPGQACHDQVHSFDGFFSCFAYFSSFEKVREMLPYFERIVLASYLHILC